MMRLESNHTGCDECALAIDPDDAAPSCGAHLLHTSCAEWFDCQWCRVEQRAADFWTEPCS